ncbi:class I SAM-dependent methyltransferase [Glycomyces sp. L485]|uniref:class I SAM-dependent methyltransferase n=1 Tax=Glycomyces sp. L485 TaxID=2909235 RepID=UPI001F4A18B9|nr:class I SAM-dependent methyltransferase [Glycomyces sp. L485]MCH7231553.1 class I SAM-dependent methyltransferase [Glycomyces sp. L485]
MSTDATPSPEQALSFGQAAELYNATRPAYPAEALGWMLGDDRLDVIDVGAGTGLLTRGLMARGHRVTAVEPDAEMLGTLTAAGPGLAAGLQGSAEDLPISDASADAVTAGQAFHWFDRERALPEIRRVLRDGGVLAPIWNTRDETVDWVAALTGIIGASKGERTAQAAAEPGFFGPHFADPEVRIFRHEKTFDGPGLLRLVQSRSVYLTADPGRRREITAGVEDLVANHPRLAGRGAFAMPYATYAFRARPN